MPTSCDAIVIGGGQAGPFLAVRLAQRGLKTVLIEREHLGGTCVNDGCMPTKTLVASARVAYLARRAADFGVVLEGPVRVDMRAVKARKDAVVQQSVGNLTTWLAGIEGLRVVRGHGRFTGPHTVAVGDEVFEAPKIFVNTGGRAVLPPWPGLDGVRCLTNTSVLELDELPPHLVIVGGSYIGLEFAQIYRRFGAEVTVLEAGDRLIAREDPPVIAAVQALLEGEGVRFHLGVHAARVEPGAGGQGARVHFATASGEQVVEGSHLLFAVGRRPNTDDLGLDRAGIATDGRGFITVDDELQTNVPGVWALGDVNGRGPFTHTSYNDHEIVAANLLGGEARRVSDRIPVYALFVDPPLARIGMNDREARAAAQASGNRVLAGEIAMSRVGRAKERGETTGFMRVLVDERSQRILGATLFGIEADEAIHALLDVMAAGAPYTVIQRCVHIHPTVSELTPTLLGDLKPL